MMRWAVAFALLVGSGVSSGQTLREKALTNSGRGGTVIDIDGPLSSMADVVRDSDLVLRGEIVAARALLNADQTIVETEYTIRPIEAFKDVHPQSLKTFGAVPPIVVRRAGGRLVTEDGLVLTTQVNIFPERECFVVGEDVIVMLRYSPAEQVFRFAGEEFGAFRIRDGAVIPMVKRVVERRKDVPRALAAFRTDLLRLLR